MLKNIERKYNTLVQNGYVILKGSQVSYLDTIVNLCKQNNVAIVDPWVGKKVVKITLN